MGINATTTLLLAGMDLYQVRLLRGAMQPKVAPGLHGAHPQPRIEPRPVHHPDPRIEQRKVIHPTPHFTPRPVHQPMPAIESAPPAPVYTRPAARPVLPAPWMEPLSNDIPPEPRPVIKQFPQTTEIIHKGTLIDFFI